MRTVIIIIFMIFTLNPAPLQGKILINEISAGGSSDWVEIMASEENDSIDISSLFVTMYYVSNEKISALPVTLRGKDIPETPFDDRFAVIHFSSIGEDETDSSGDINSNGIRDLYCNNYGLWNTDCVVSVDDDDDPSNGGILDFAAFSDRDGTPNSTISSYMENASGYGEWIICTSANPQECMIFTGSKGMSSYSTLSRVSSADTNSPDDFFLTPYATPGRKNIVSSAPGRKHIIKPLTKKIFHRYENGTGVIPVKLFIYRECSIKLRIFNAAGTGTYSSGLIKDVPPGYYTHLIRETKLRGKKLTGLYPVKVEGAADGRTDISTVYLVIIRR